jgi:PIN domain nuclease of toxin-antitoxin system
MNLLLDTHAFLWYITGDSQLPEHVVESIGNSSNHCFVSVASIWEIAIKLSLNKLEIKGGFKTIEDFLEHNDFELLPIDLDDIKMLLDLEMVHRDPFDRIIIAQALAAKLIVITKDSFFKNYHIDVMW